MKTVIKFLMLLFIFSFTAETFSQDRDMSQTRKWIEESASRLEEAMVNGDNEYMMSLYGDNVYSLPAYEPMVHGKDNVMTNYKKMMESGFKFNSVDFEVVDVIGSGDMAVEIGTYKMNMSVPGMNDPIDDNGKYITVWEKDSAGNWKIAAETWNSDMNPWQNMPGEGMN
jgi:ketosteroid isomerase-like protein